MVRTIVPLTAIPRIDERFRKLAGAGFSEDLWLPEIDPEDSAGRLKQTTFLEILEC